MAKELPYYKHEPSEWLEGEIQMCSDAAIVCFQNLCSGYWLKLGCISYAFALHKYCRKDAGLLKELIDGGVVDISEDKIIIKFLDKQLEEFTSVSEKRSQAANKRWNNANALQVESKSNAIREEKSKEEKSKEDKIIKDVLLEKEPKVSDKAFDFKKALLSIGVSEKHATDWMDVRRKQKAANTETAFDEVYKQIKKSGFHPDEAVRIAAANSWRGLKADWLKNATNNGTTKNNSASEQLDEAKRDMAARIAEAFGEQEGSEPRIQDNNFGGHGKGNAYTG